MEDLPLLLRWRLMRSCTASPVPGHPDLPPTLSFDHFIRACVSLRHLDSQFAMVCGAEASLETEGSTS